MKIIRWAAVLVSVLMALMNLGVALGGDEDPGTALIIAGLVLGVAGIASAVGLARHARWGKPAVLAVGALNAIGAVIALINSTEGAVIGLGVSAAILVLGALTSDADARPATPAPSYN